MAGKRGENRTTKSPAETLTGGRLLEGTFGTAVVNRKTRALYDLPAHDFPARLLPPPGTASRSAAFWGLWVLLRSRAGERAGLGGAEEDWLFLLLEENWGWGRGLCSISETISVQLTRPETGGTRSGKPSPSSWSRRGVAPWRLLLFAVSHARRCRQAQARILVYSCCSFSPRALGEKGFCAQEECECYS